MKENLLFLLILFFFINEVLSQTYSNLSLQSSWQGQNVRVEEGDTAAIDVKCYYKGDTGEDIDSVSIFRVNNGQREMDKEVSVAKFPKHIYPNDTCTFRFKVITQNQPVIFERFVSVITKSKRRAVFSFYFTIIPKESHDLEMSEHKHDFGKLIRGKKIIHKVIYKNIGSDTIRLSPVGLKGNTAITASKMILLPGDTGSFTCAINTCNYSGPFNNRILFSTENIPDYKYELLFSGWLEKREHPITFEKMEYDFGTIILKKDSAAKTISYNFPFKNTSKSNVIINRVSTGDGGCYGDPSTRDPIKPGETGFIKVFLHPYPKQYRKSICVQYVTSVDDEGCSYSDMVCLKFNGQVRTEE